MNRRTRLLLATLATALSTADTHANTLVDFGDSTQTDLPFYIEDDLRFTPVGTFTTLSLIKLPPAFELPGSDGGAYTFVIQGFSELEVTHETNQPFSLLSARLSTANSSLAEVTFTGTPSGGGPKTVEQVTVDAATGFNTFSFSTLNNLESLRIAPTGPGGLFFTPDSNIDSLTFNIVPEPTSLALLGLGGLLLSRRSRRSY